MFPVDGVGLLDGPPPTLLIPSSEFVSLVLRYTIIFSSSRTSLSCGRNEAPQDCVANVLNMLVSGNGHIYCYSK